jgi:hypothetical protein
MHRVIASLLAGLTIVAGMAPLECAGWQATAAARMNCCARAQDGCANQMAADDCCGRSEQREQSRISAPAFATIMPAIAAPVLAPAGSALPFLPTATAHRFQFNLHQKPQRPSFVLTSILRI